MQGCESISCRGFLCVGPRSLDKRSSSVLSQGCSATDPGTHGKQAHKSPHHYPGMVAADMKTFWGKSQHLVTGEAEGAR